MDPSELIGLSEKAAKDKIRKAGIQYRVRRRDTKRFAASMEFRTDRVYLESDNGKVPEAEIG